MTRKHKNVRSDPSPRRISSVMSGSTLTTSLRRAEQHDVEVAIEAPPPVTFTVPSFRSRNHRGGESILLKYAYPSGFGQQTKPGHHFTLSAAAAAAADRRNQNLPPSSTQGGLVSETKGFGVPKWGAASKKWLLNVTRVVVGAEVADAGAGNELIHFGPEFPCGPTECLSPRAWSHRTRTSSPLSPTRMTIDGSTLKEKDLLAASGTERETYQSLKQFRLRSPPFSVGSPRDGQASAQGPGERKRNRADTAERAHSADTSAVYPCPGESATMPPPKHCAGRHVLHSSSGREGGDGGGVAPEARVSGGGSRSAESRVEQDNRPTHGQKIHAKEDTSNAAVRRYVDADPQESSNEHSRCNTGYKESLEGRATDDQRSSQVSTALPKVVRPVDSGQIPNVTYREETAGRGGVEESIAFLDEQSGSLKEAWAVSGNNSSTLQVESACPLASATTLEASSASCESSLSGSSVDPLMAKRSLSSLDTERYGGTLSKDATDILRSHLESQTVHSKDIDTCLSSGQDMLAADHVAATSPAPPATSRLQLLDSLLGACPSAGQTGQASPETVFSETLLLQPIARPRGCYVRTRGDVVLAVVRKKRLLDCKHDKGLRAVKAAARPVCIKADMSLAEGVRAILASGVLLPDWAEEGSRVHQEGRGPWESAGPRGASGQSASLQYFDFRAGAWKAILSESDWKVMLAAPAGPQGAGVTFGFGGTNGRGADFLVAVTAAPRSPPAPAIKSSKFSAMKWPTWSRLEDGPIPRAPQDNKTAWRYAASVTPNDVIRSAEHVRSKQSTEYLHNECHGLESRAKEATDNIPSTALETGPQHLKPMHTISSSTKSEGSIRVVSGKARQEQSPLVLGRQLAGLVGRGRQCGPGPGAAVWTSSTTNNRGGGCSAPRGPEKAKVRCMVKHLEARLKLQGQRAGGLLGAPLLKIDMPYTKELAKWGYDDILGIPRETAPGRGS